MLIRRRKKYDFSEDSSHLGGMLYVFSGPSGAGKTTIMQQVERDLLGIKKVVGYTTREMRPGETNGITYHYITSPEFKEKNKKKDFLFHFTFNQHHYGFGLSKKEVLTVLASGRDLLVDMDYSQVPNLKAEITSTSSIFILPPSLDNLYSRLKQRGDSAESVTTRMNYSQNMINHAYFFDYLVLNANGKLHVAIENVRTLIDVDRQEKTMKYFYQSFTLFKKLNERFLQDRLTVYEQSKKQIPL